MNPLVIALGAGVALSGLAAAAQIADSQSAALAWIETGVVCNPLFTDTIPAPGTVSGVVNVLETLPEFASPSRRVPAVIGISFGALVQSATQDYPIVNMTVHHPPMGPQGITYQTYTTSISATGQSPILYSLEYDEELVIGTWTFEASADGEDLYSLSFEIVPPQQLPELAHMCGYENLLS